MARVRAAGFELVNLDSTVVAQAPKLAAHIPAMCANVAQCLGVAVGQVNVKAKTAEKLGPVGQGLSMEAQAVALLDELGADNTGVQYDIYHAQRMEGELAATLQRFLPRIGHIQLADNPGRNEPGTGEINYSYLFAHLDRIGYSGWIGCEYKPAQSTEAGLHWRTALAG